MKCEFEITTWGRLPQALLTSNEIVEFCITHIHGQEATRIVCSLRDQSELRGFLSRLWNLNQSINSVMRVSREEE